MNNQLFEHNLTLLLSDSKTYFNSFTVVYLVFLFFFFQISVESTKKIQKTKEIKKELEELIGNNEIHDNIEIKEKLKMVERPEEALKVIQEFNENIRNNKKNIVSLT